MDEPDRGFRLHFHFKGESRQMLSTGPDVDQAIETSRFWRRMRFSPVSTISDCEAIFTDESCARLTETKAAIKYGIS